MLGATMRELIDGFTDTIRRVFTDGGVLLLLVGAIAIYSMFYPLPYLHEAVKESPVGVVDLDHSSLSRQLTRWVDAHETTHVVLRTSNPEALEAAIAAGEIAGYLLIPAGLRADVLRGRRAVIVYGGDAGRFLVLKQVLTGFAESAGTLSAGIDMRRQMAAGLSEPQAMAAQSPVALHLRPLFNTREGYGSYLIPAVFVLGVGMIFGTDRGKTPRPVASGLAETTARLVARFIGGCGAYVLLYAAHLIFYFGFCFWLFNIPRGGDPVALALFAVPFLLAITLFAQTLAGWCWERVTSVQALLVTSLLFLFLAGFAWPLALMPVPLLWLAHLVPSTAGIQGFLRLNQMGATLAEVGHWWWTLWVLCAVYAWPAWRSWRRLRPMDAKARLGNHLCNANQNQNRTDPPPVQPGVPLQP
jgi:ABC-2 type transport system permease protein